MPRSHGCSRAGLGVRWRNRWLAFVVCAWSQSMAAVLLLWINPKVVGRPVGYVCAGAVHSDLDPVPPFMPDLGAIDCATANEPCDRDRAANAPR